MSLIETALNWIERGAYILPAQPNSKSLAGGYGPNRAVIRTPSAALSYFTKHKNPNIAVFCQGDMFALDFDDHLVLSTWMDQLPTEYLTTYQETSPRGMHFFYRSPLPEGLHLVDGVEIKRVVLVSPSVVDGFYYRVIDPDLAILKVEGWEKILFSLLSEKAPITLPGVATRVEDDLVSRIKAAFPVWEMATRLTELESSDSSGRWWKARCPFHDDQHPSFWLDRERGLWGCHACGIRGDVINLYARAHNLSLQASIREMVDQLEREATC